MKQNFLIISDQKEFWFDSKEEMQLFKNHLLQQDKKFELKSVLWEFNDDENEFEITQQETIEIND